MKPTQSKQEHFTPRSTHRGLVDTTLLFHHPRLSDLLSSKSLDGYPRPQPNQNMRPALDALTVAKLFPGEIANAAAAQCVMSGLWLVHGFLDQAHEICQSIPTATGSFWHAIMHRLEGDYWNSKYWYRQVGRHPVIERIAVRLQVAWNPSDFVDQCERLQKTPLESPAQMTARHVAQVEWQELFTDCWAQANSGQPFATDAAMNSPRTGDL